MNQSNLKKANEITNEVERLLNSLKSTTFYLQAVEYNRFQITPQEAHNLLMTRLKTKRDEAHEIGLVLECESTAVDIRPVHIMTNGGSYAYYARNIFGRDINPRYESIEAARFVHPDLPLVRD